jgi:hypothetical protein
VPSIMRARTNTQTHQHKHQVPHAGPTVLL